MTHSTAARLAGGLAVPLAPLLAAGLGLSVLNDPGRLQREPLAFFENIWLTLVFGLYGAVGAFVAARRPGNAIGWLLLAVGLLVALGLVAEQYAIFSVATRPGAPGGGLAAWVSFPAWIVAVGLLFTFVLLLFPTGRLPSARWRPVAWLAGGLLAVTALVVAFSPYDDPPYPGLANPLALPALEPVAAGLQAVLLPLLTGCALASAASVLLRYRRAQAEERQQLKWFLYAAAVLVAGTLMELLSPRVHPALAVPAYVLLDVGYTALPLAIGVAVLRYRLWDIDVLIRRTLVYTALTLSLALVYLGSVVVLQNVFRLLTGQAQSQLVTVLSTLGIAALFSPLRQRLQQAIDRRFYRRRYDAARILAAFGAALRDEVDFEQLRRHLERAVEETLQPEHVSLWVRSDE